VTDLNSPPVLDVISDQTIPEGEALSLLVTASDPGGEIPSLSASGQPAFVSFNDNGDGTGTFVITPGYTDVGMYTITVIATDGIFDDSQSFVLTVSEVNAAPVLANIPTQTLEEGSTGQFDISASDPDMEVPSISFQGLEPWMVFTDNGDGSGTLNLAPDFNQFGNYTIAVIVTDGAGLSDEQQVVIMVTEVTEEPVWTVTGTVKNANCLNEQGSIVLSVSGGFGELAYSWSNGATTRDIFDLASGVYSVIITDQKNNTNVKTFTVNTQPGPQKPMISLESENVLVSTPASSYQWNLDGEVIEGETGQSIEVTLSGEYSVSITDDLGCTVMSDPYSISYEYSELNVYPNPTDGQFTAEVILMEDEMLSFVLIDEIGRQTPLKVADLKAGRHELEFTLSESLANGVYILMNNGKSFASNTNRIVLFR
jgi:hypothetical protein